MSTRAERKEALRQNVRRVRDVLAEARVLSAPKEPGSHDVIDAASIVGLRVEPLTEATCYAVYDADVVVATLVCDPRSGSTWLAPVEP